MTTKNTRRDILRALGVSTAAAPLIPLLEQQAEAQAGFPTRLLLVMSPNGSVPDRFWPGGGEDQLSFAPGSITEPLAPLRSKIIFPRNLNRQRSGPGGHEGPLVTLWTGASVTRALYAGGPSVDQLIAKALPEGPTFRSLQFGVQHTSSGLNPRVLHTMTYAGADQPIAPESNPYRMFGRLMLGGAGQDFESLRKRRFRVIDAVQDELRALTPKIAAADRIKLEQHLEGIDSVEKRLMTASAGNAPACGKTPKMTLGLDHKANANFPEVLRMQSEMVVSAFTCDLTRVATLQWARCACEIRHNWVGPLGDHHGLSHMTDAKSKAGLASIERWYMSRLAELLQALDSVREGDGTLLDHTMVIYVNNLTDGAAHSCTPAITLVAGKGGGKLRTSPNGRLVNAQGFDFTQLLVTACHVMGLPSINKVGDLGRNGPIPSLLA